MTARLAAAALAAGLLAAGCGDDTKPAGSPSAAGSTPPPASTQPPATTVVVPDVRGAAVGEAYDVLHQAGLRVAIPQEYRYGTVSQPVPKGQSPEVGTKVAPGSTITLTLGKGPTGRPQYTTETVTMPDLTGMPLAAAARKIAGLGLGFHIAAMSPLEPSDAATLLDNYRVIAQSVEPGTEIDDSRRKDRNMALFVELIG
jgi:beta-lactam-binding protein with PASTA domain